MAYESLSVVDLQLIFQCIDEYECRNVNPYDDDQTVWTNLLADGFSEENSHYIPSDSSTY
jgi:hypothetical protein